MRLASVADSLLERVLLGLGLVPTPLMDTFVSFALARTLLTATKLEVFEALSSGPLTAEEVAGRCGTNPRATEKLLFALAGSRYLQRTGGRYSLAPVAGKWMLRASARSMRDAVLHRYLDARLMEHAEEYVRTGRPVDFHEPGKMSPEEWGLYQRGQRSGALYSAPEVARRVPMPKDPRTMLDIGGAHGCFSASLCRRHPGLRSTILDLPEAIEQARPLLAGEGLDGRIEYAPGNALTAELGAERYDLIFVANLVHHFDESANRALMGRIARALKPGGCCAILEIARPAIPEKAGQIGALTNFYFALTSASGTWTYEEIASWQREAGLRPAKPIRLRWSPGYGMQTSRKG